MCKKYKHLHTRTGFSCGLAAERAFLILMKYTGSILWKLSKPQEGKLFMLTLSIIVGLIDTFQNRLYAFAVLALLGTNFKLILIHFTVIKDIHRTIV